MLRSRWKIVVVVLAVALALTVGKRSFWRQQPVAAQSGPKPANEDSLGYGTVFNAELQKIGQISPDEFARRYPAPDNYVKKFSWDPTTAKFWDEFNKNPMPDGKFDPTRPPSKRHGFADFRLNEKELAKFKENGFVVSERLGGASFAEVFYAIYARDLPVFVSSDAILHAWHRSYDAMLQELEETYLANSLNEILTAMADKIPNAQKDYGDGLLGDSLKDADYFLAVAQSLLADAQQPTKLSQERRVANTLRAVKDLQIEKFVLFGRERDVDFSQFKVRGHYEKSEQLKRYFKAMMWCGRTDMRIAGGVDYFGELSSARELGSAVVLNDLLNRSGKFEQWQRFDRLIQTFVGRTDSATFAHLEALMNSAGIKSPADLKTAEDVEKLQADILAGKVGLQEIRGDVYTSPLGGQIVLPRSFTLLGQKFVVDSWVTAKIVYDEILWDGRKVERLVPSCADVAFAALGNNQITPLLVERMKAGPHQWRDRKNYQHNLAAVRNTIDLHPASAWDENLYMGWLGALRELSTPTTDGQYPEALRTQAWGMKTLNTQLASWTQLRHDTILYAKQSYTGGATCFYPAGFVEPAPHFWTRFEKMTTRAADLIEKTPYPESMKICQDRQVWFLKNFAEKVGTLKSIAEKQLAQKELSKDDAKFLDEIVQIHNICGGPFYNGWYPSLFYQDREKSGKWDALVADVHTAPPDLLHPGCVLHQGIGNIDLLMIAIDSGKDRMIFAGPTLSHYEFEMAGTVRKSDSEWQKDINAGKLPPRPEWTRGYLVPGLHPMAANFRAKD